MTRAAAAVLFLLAGAPAWAHDEKLSVSRVEIRDDGVSWTIDVSIAGLEKILKFPAEPVDLSDRQFQSMKDLITGYLRTCLKVEIDGQNVDAEPGSMEPLLETFVATGDKYIAHARVTLRFPSAKPPKRVTLTGNVFGTITDSHQAVVGVGWKGARRTFKRTGPYELELTPTKVQPTFWSTAAEFLLWGTHHILVGYDHISFLLALLLAARKLGEMVRVATSFTIAHSITLVLAARDVLRIHPQITESLIAFSIAYVAAENYFVKDGKHRWILTFAFGLVHGVGFSSMLRERLVDVDSITMPVVWFNLGVELGQIAILLVAFPILHLIRKAPTPEASDRRQQLLVRIGSAPILLLGIAWMVDRIFGLGKMPF